MRIGKATAVAAVLLGTFAVSAFGAGEKLKIIDTNAWGQSLSGGPFEVDPIGFSFTPVGANAITGNFISFCLERDEHLSQGATFFVGFNDAAVHGGNGGPDPDPISDETKYLYSNFIRGTLQSQLNAWQSDGGTGGTFTYGAGASGDSFQRAIWILEQETGGGDDTLAIALRAMASWAIGGGSGADLTGIDHVMVMNLWGDAGFTDAHQDLLVMIPLPAPVWMAGLGLFGVIGGTVYRRRTTGSTSSRELSL